MLLFIAYGERQRYNYIIGKQTAALGFDLTRSVESPLIPKTLAYHFIPS
jgi:hypothetical protein